MSMGAARIDTDRKRLAAQVSAALTDGILNAIKGRDQRPVVRKVDLIRRADRGVDRRAPHAAIRRLVDRAAKGRQEKLRRGQIRPHAPLETADPE